MAASEKLHVKNPPKDVKILLTRYPVLMFQEDSNKVRNLYNDISNHCGMDQEHQCYNVHWAIFRSSQSLPVAVLHDALSTFYLRLYGVRLMVKDDSNSEKGNPLPPHVLIFPIIIKGSFILYMHHDHPTHRMTHTTVFVALVVEHWLE